MLQLLKDLEKIGGYVRIGFPRVNDKSIYMICKAIAEGRDVVLGFSHADWTYVVNTGKFREQENFSGHILKA